MKKLILWLAMIVLSAGQSICAQSPGQVTAQPGNLTGMLYASSFGQWQVPQGNQGQYSWSSASFCNANANGFYLNPVFAVGTPIYIKDQVVANSEIVTPSAVTIGGFGCSITVNPVNKHNTFTLTSATGGLQEAINFAKGLPYQVILTPDWTRLGGTTGMILAAKGSAAVTISDQRSPCIIAYLWSGSSYVAQPSSCSGGPGSSVVLKVNGTATGVSQTVQNLNSTTPAASTGLQNCIWQNDGAGNDTCSYSPANYFNLTPPIGGNYVVLLPTAGAVTHTPSRGCTAAAGPLPGGIPGGSIVRTATSTGDSLGCQITWSGFTLPVGINPAHVTAIYSFFVGSRYATLNDAFSGFQCTDTVEPAFGPSGSFYGFPLSTYYGVNGSTVTTFNFSTAYCTANDADSGDSFQPYGTVQDSFAEVGLIVYSTDAPAPPPQPAISLNFTYPLQFNPTTSTLSLSAPYDWAEDTGTVNFYAVALPVFGNPSPGTEVKFTPGHTSTVTAPTLNLNAAGALTIIRAGGAALTVGDISTTACASGPCIADVILDEQNFWELQNPVTGGGGGGMVYPSAGLAASTGSAWRTPTFSDVVVLWAGGSCSGYLKSDGTCGTSSSSGLSGMTASQVPIAATATTVTSSKQLAGSGAGITTGPVTSTNLDCANFTGTAGQIADSGSPCGSGGGGSPNTPAYSVQAANSGVTGFTSDSNIKIDTTNHALDVGTMGTYNVTIAPQGTMSASWILDTTTPATALASLGGGGGGLSGMTAGQIPVAATASTVTSSKALAGSGTGITTGPTTTTTNDCAKFSTTTGQIADSGSPCGGGGLASGAALVAPAVGTSSNADWQNQSSISHIQNFGLINTSSTWKLGFFMPVGGITGGIAILRTLPGSLTVIDATAVTVGGSSTPTFASNTFTYSDEITLPLDTAHDFYVVTYFTSAGANASAAAFNNCYGGFTSNYASGNALADTTVPTITTQLYCVMVGAYEF